MLQKRLRRLLGDVTFLEAFNRSGGCSTVTAHAVCVPVAQHAVVPGHLIKAACWTCQVAGLLALLLPAKVMVCQLAKLGEASQLLPCLTTDACFSGQHHLQQCRLLLAPGSVGYPYLLARAGRVLNVAVSAADTNEPPRVLNYLTSPNVVIWSAVSCSSAFPYLFKPQELLSKDEKGNMCG